MGAVDSPLSPEKAGRRPWGQAPAGTYGGRPAGVWWGVQDSGGAYKGVIAGRARKVTHQSEIFLISFLSRRCRSLTTTAAGPAREPAAVVRRVRSGRVRCRRSGRSGRRGGRRGHCCRPEFPGFSRGRSARRGTFPRRRDR